MHVVEFSVGKGLVDVSQLVWVDVEVVVGDDSGDELAVQVVVCDVDRPDAPVSVGVGIRARAKRSPVPKWLGFPVFVVVREAVHFLVVDQTGVVFLLPPLLPRFSRLLQLASLLAPQTPPKALHFDPLASRASRVLHPLPLQLLSLPFRGFLLVIGWTGAS